MKNRFIKVFVIIISLFFLFSCGEETAVVDGLLSKELTNFTISVPNTWVELNSNKGQLPKPSFGEIAFAISSPTYVEGFSNNLLILKDKLNKEISSKDFSIFSNIGIKEDYYAYKELSKKEIIFKDEEKSVLFTFEARYNDSTPRLKFLQTAYICKEESYLLTIALSDTVTDPTKYEPILESFTCKK